MEVGLKGHIILIVKLAVSAALMAFLLSQLDVGAVLRHVAALPLAIAVWVILVLLVQALIQSLRWRLILRAVGLDLPFMSAFYIFLVGMFFNQTLPSSIGGDAVKILLAAQRGIPLGRVGSSVLLDRVCGLLTLVTMAALGHMVLPPAQTIRTLELGAYGIFAVTMTGMAVMLVSDQMVKRLVHWKIFRLVTQIARDGRRIFLVPGTLLQIAVLSAASQLCIVFAVYLMAVGLDIRLGMSAALAAVPIVLLSMMLPISIAGWGVREGAMVLVLGLMGVPAEGALALGFLLGLALLAEGVPGGVLWVTMRNRKDVKPLEKVSPDGRGGT